MKSRMSSFAFIVGVSALASACVTRGNNFPSDLSWIEKNKTTQVDVERKLGTPYSVGNSGGVKTWTYGYYHHQVAGESKVKELKFYWTPDLKVQDYSFNSSMPEDRSNMIMKR